MNKLIRVLMLASALLVAYGLPNHSQAAPPYARTITYYTGCAGSETAVGGAYRDCNGHWSYWGQQSGEWRKLTMKNVTAMNSLLTITFSVTVSGYKCHT